MTVSANGKHRILFVSSNEQWGGSEELWRRAAAILAGDGHHIAVLKPRIAWEDPTIRALIDANCTVADLRGPRWWPRKLRSLASILWPFMRRVSEMQMRKSVRRHRPSLVVISQGLNHDGWLEAETAQALGKATVLISQKADDIYWPSDSLRARLRRIYPIARAALFVSQHNLAVTEEQLGLRLTNAQIVPNPFEVAWAAAPPWPGGDGLDLACCKRLQSPQRTDHFHAIVRGLRIAAAQFLHLTIGRRDDRRPPSGPGISRTGTVGKDNRRLEGGLHQTTLEMQKGHVNP